MGMAIIGLFAIFFVFGSATLIFTWRVTKNMRLVWLRHLTRAVIAAIAFTPTIVPAPEFHGSLPMPAALFPADILSNEDYDKCVNLIYGGIPLLIVALVYWSVAMLVSYLIRKYPADQ
jgi:hypothetical protein